MATPSNSNYTVDGLIAYFEMAVKVMGFRNPEESSYEYHAVKMLKQLREERDEARREVCSMNETGLRMRESDKQREAKRRGWDCFPKENGNA